MLFHKSAARLREAGSELPNARVSSASASPSWAGKSAALEPEQPSDTGLIQGLIVPGPLQEPIRPHEAPATTSPHFLDQIQSFAGESPPLALPTF